MNAGRAGRINSGRTGVPPRGRPAPTAIASTPVDVRRNARQCDFNRCCADRDRVHAVCMGARRPNEFGAQGRAATRSACADRDRVHAVWGRAGRMNSGRTGVPPRGRPALTAIASTPVDVRRNARQVRFQSLLRRPRSRPRRWTPGGTPIRCDFNRRPPPRRRPALRPRRMGVRRRMNSGRRGVPPRGRPAPTAPTAPPGETPVRCDFNRRRAGTPRCVHAVWGRAGRMNSGRTGVPPRGRPAPTAIASTPVDARRNGRQVRFQSLNRSNR
jgi:hypothetical protein